MKAFWLTIFLLSAATVLAAEPPRQSSSSSSVAAIIIEARPETEFEKKKAEALDICLRIYRWYGSVEVKTVGSGKGAFVVCQ